jgi:hypothetical protein
MTRIRTGAVVVGAAAVLAAVAGPMPAAHADTAGNRRTAAYAAKGKDCSWVGCSSTVNKTGYAVTAYFNWCRAGDSTADWTKKEPTCTDDGAKQKKRILAANDHTPWDQDWDAFRVDAGWCYIVDFDLPGPANRHERYDRRGKSAVWVKVGDEADAYVTRQTLKPC